MTDEQAISSFFYGSREYNLITFNDYTIGGHGTWGAVAIGGTFHNTGSNKANFLEEGYKANWIKGIPGRSSISDPSVIFNGKLDLGTGNDVRVELGGGKVAINSSIVPGTWSGNRYTISATNQQIQAPGGMVDLASSTSVVNFASLKSNLSTAQAALAIHSTSLTGAEYSKSGSDITINAGGKGIDFLDVSTSALNSTSNFKVTVSKDDLLVVNLHVDSAKLSIGNFVIDNDSSLASSAYLTNTSANRLLWNVIFDNTDISTLTIDLTTGSQTFWGSILSTTGSITANNRVTGQVIANNFTNTATELHMALFETDVPEPSTIALIIGSLSLGFVFWQRRQRKM